MSVFIQPIYTQVVGAGGAATVTFNNIPQGFMDLIIKFSVRSTSSDSGTNWVDGSGIQFNNTTIGSMTQLYGTGVGAGTGRGLNAMYMGVVNSNVSNSNTFTTGELYIPNYTSGIFKQAILDTVAEVNTANALMHSIANHWINSSPLTSIKFLCGNGSWAQGSSFTVYGVLNRADVLSPTAPTIGTITDQAGLLSVAFTPASNDGADSYKVTTNPASNTVYGAESPVVVPVTVGTSYTAQVEAVNSLGSTASNTSSAVTTYNNYSSIATMRVTSGTANSITFTNIPQHYQHLQVRAYSMTTNTNANICVNFNGISTGYARHELTGDGASASSYGNFNDSVFTMGWLSSTSSSTSPHVGVIDILDYTSTAKYKTARVISGRDLNGSGGWVQTLGGHWRDYSPVSTITLSQITWSPGTIIALYGIG